VDVEREPAERVDVDGRAGRAGRLPQLDAGGAGRVELTDDAPAGAVRGCLQLDPDVTGLEPDQAGRAQRAHPGSGDGVEGVGDQRRELGVEATQSEAGLR
jgi:hypothetical protein